MENDKKLALKMTDFTPEEFNILYNKSLKDKKVSYIPYLLPIRSIFKSQIIPKFLKIKQKRIKQQISDSTANLLIKIDQLFKNYKNLDEIKLIQNELSKRKDIFEESMKFLENVKLDTYNELYYWYPGLKVADTISLIFSFYSNQEFNMKYRKFVAERYIFENKMPLKILENKIPPSLNLEIKIMLSDKKRMCDDLVTHVYWCHENCYSGKFINKGNIKISPVYCLSHCEIEINGKNYVVSIKNLRLLYRKDLSVKEFWEERGVNWDEDVDIEGISLAWLI